jgi:hypothetical protein
MAFRVFPSGGIAHEADAKLALCRGTLQGLVWLSQWPSSICLARFVIFREIRELLAHLCNLAQDVFLLCVFGPSVPPTLLTIEWITAFSAFLENNLGRSLEICHIPKECRIETRDINIYSP